MYDEWLFAKHTHFYDALPHYFMEFDVFDTEKRVFLDTVKCDGLLGGLVEPVKALSAGTFKQLKELQSLIGRSNFITDKHHENLNAAALEVGVDPFEAWKHTDPSEKMEGLYVKWEEDGIVKGRYKYVRDTFTNAILSQDSHWYDRPIIQNRLAEGALERMFA